MPNILLWIKLKQVFFDRSPYLFPEEYLKLSQISPVDFFITVKRR